MAIEIKVSDIGADEAKITEILVKVGDKAEAEQSLTTVEDDRASMEVSSPRAGIIKEIKVSVGDKTRTSTLIMIFNSVNNAADTAPARAEEKKEAAPVVAPTVATAKDVNIPDIGSDRVEVTEILVKVGDKVEAEQSLITVEDGKTSMEVPIPLADAIKKVKVDASDKMSIGLLIMVFEVTNGAGAAAPATRQEAALAAAPTPTAGIKEVNVPDIGGDKVKVTEVMVKASGRAAVEQPLITIESGKASIETPALFVDVMKGLKVNTGDKVKTGSLIMILEVEGAAPMAAPAKQEAAAPTLATKAEAPAIAPAARAESKSEFVRNDAYVHATPLIRRLTREFGANPTRVKGASHEDRILHGDVQTYVEEAIKHTGAAPATTGDGISGILPRLKVDFNKFDEIKEVKLDRIQKISGTNLSRSWVIIPHVARFGKTDIAELEAFRKQQNEEAAKRKLDVKIVPVVFITKAIAATLEQMPRFNNSLSEDDQRLTLERYINIGVAMDIPSGLVAPVFKDANKKGIVELSRELMITSRKTHNGKLTMDEVQGGYFTISGIGGLDTTHFTSIVNASEVAILGVSKSTMELVRNDKGFVPRPILPISLPFDHHVIDGADGACFVTTINSTLSNVRRLVM